MELAYRCPKPKVGCQEHLQEISSGVCFSSFNLVSDSVLDWMFSEEAEEAPEKQVTSGNQSQ